MSESIYNLVFEGKIVTGQDLAEVKKRLQKVFNKDAHTIEKLFSGRKVKLKQGLTEDQAIQYKAKMHSIGALCEVEAQAAKAAATHSSTATAKIAAQSGAEHSSYQTNSSVAEEVGSSVVANVSQPTVEPGAKALKLADIDKGVVGSVPRVDLPTSYKVGVIAMGVTMVLLPLLYISLIGLVGYGVISHSVSNTGWMQSLGAKFGFIAYMIPIVAGVTVILFMVKPLFAPPAMKSKTVVLDSIKEPLLFHFVNKIATAVGAPRPKQIELNCEVNASASFRKGFLSFMGDDLVLTIGMPLLAGFNTRQLAGVLAHEFGHFTQGAGMRFHYLAYKINSWLYYSVFARDRWDEKLDKLTSETDNWLSVILNFARGGVWVTRKILYVFMMAGQAVSSYMLRQMEFDADRYEAHVGGSDQFKDTTLRLQRLGAAYQVSHDYLEQAWEDKKLVNDFPSLVAHNASKLPEKLDQALLAQMEEAKTHIYDSHPSDKDRIANAASQQARGIVTLNRHSRELFKSFDLLAKQVSELYYAHELGLDFDASKLVDIGQVVKIAHDNEKQQEAFRKYFKDMAPVFDLPLSVNIFDTSKTDWDELLAQYRDVNSQLADQIADRRMLMKKADDCFSRYQHFSAIIDLEEAGFVLFPEWFDITPETLEAGKKQKAIYEKAWMQTMAELNAMFAINDQRLSIALTLLNHPKAIEANPEHAHHLKTRNHLSLLVNNIRRNAQTIVEFRNNHARLLAFMSCAHAISGQKQADVNSVRMPLLEELKQSAQQLTAALSRLDYPYVAEGEHQTIAEYVETFLPRATQFNSEWEFYLASGNIILEKLDAVYGRIISGLANVALTVDIMIPYIEGRAPMPEIQTQPEIEQETYVPAEVTQEELQQIQMAQAVGAESFNNAVRAPSGFTAKPVASVAAQAEAEKAVPKEPVKINVREIKNPGQRSVFAIDDSFDDSVEEESEKPNTDSQAAETSATEANAAGESQESIIQTEEKTVEPVAVTSDKIQALSLEQTAEQQAAEDSIEQANEEPPVVASQNSDNGKLASFATDSVKMELVKPVSEEAVNDTAEDEKPQLTVNANVDAGVRSSFAIDESTDESKPAEPVVERPEAEPKIVAKENNDAGVRASFAVDESEPKPEAESVLKQVGSAQKDVEESADQEVQISVKANVDAGVPSSFAIDESQPAETAIEQTKTEVETKIVAKENNVAGTPASFSIDESKPVESANEPQKAEEESRADIRESSDASAHSGFSLDESSADLSQSAVVETGATSQTTTEIKKPNPFLPQSAVANKQQDDKLSTTTPKAEPEQPKPSVQQQEVPAYKAPNPFLANVKSYQEKLAREKESQEATISMDALNAGALPSSSTSDGSAKQDKLSSFSTGSLSLEPMSTDANSSETKEDDNTVKPDPESVVVQKPDVLNTLGSSDNPEQGAPKQFFESPGLPKNSPTQERGLRPEPPSDPFKTFGSDLSLEEESTEPDKQAEQSQAETGSNESAQPGSRPSSH